MSGVQRVNRKTDFDATKVSIVSDLEWLKEPDKLKWNIWLNEKVFKSIFAIFKQLIYFHVIYIYS